MRTQSRAVALLIDRSASVADGRPACAPTRPFSAPRRLSMVPHWRDQTFARNRSACRCCAKFTEAAIRGPRSIAVTVMGVRHGADPRHRAILGLVGSRRVAYLGECRVKAAKFLTERFGAALKLFSIDGGRYPTMQEGLEALALAPGGLEVWNGPDAKGGRVTLDPWGHPHQCRSLVDHSPDAIVVRGADDRAGGTYAADCSHVER